MKKILWTLNLDNAYSPPICSLTYPLFRRYADKIGAEFRVISERVYESCYPITIEKLQVGSYHGHPNRWNIYVDSDTLIHPDFFDVTDHIDKSTVLFQSTDMAGNRFRYDDYFRRDGRNIGACNWFIVASDWCDDLWHFPEMDLDGILWSILPIQEELSSGHCSPSHLIDDYILSRNIARYGLKVTTLPEVLKRCGQPETESGRYLWHMYNCSEERKLLGMLHALKVWGVPHEEPAGVIAM